MQIKSKRAENRAETFFEYSKVVRAAATSFTAIRKIDIFGRHFTL